MIPGGQIISGAGAIGGAGQVQRPYGQLFDTPSVGNFRGDGKGQLDKFIQGFEGYKPREKSEEEKFYGNLNQQLGSGKEASSFEAGDNLVVYNPAQQDPIVIGGEPGKEGYGGAIGAGVGSLFGPVGRFAGGIFGKLLF